MTLGTKHVYDVIERACKFRGIILMLAYLIYYIVSDDGDARGDDCVAAGNGAQQQCNQPPRRCRRRITRP